MGVSVALISVFLAALPATVSARTLCLQSSDAKTLVLPHFHVKKGGTSAVGGWVVEPGPYPGLTVDSPLSGQTITTSDGQHVAMDLTEGGSALVRGPDGKLDGGGTTDVRVFHAIRLDAGSSGKIGPGASGYDARFQVSAFGSNLDLGATTITAAACPKDLGELGLPSGN